MPLQPGLIPFHKVVFGKCSSRYTIRENIIGRYDSIITFSVNDIIIKNMAFSNLKKKWKLRSAMASELLGNFAGIPVLYSSQ